MNRTEAPRTSAADLTEVLAGMFSEYPMGGQTREVKADPEQIAWLGNLVVAGHADADRSHWDHPDHGVCAHCEQPLDEGQDPEAAEHAAHLAAEDGRDD